MNLGRTRCLRQGLGGLVPKLVASCGRERFTLAQSEAFAANPFLHNKLRPHRLVDHERDPALRARSKEERMMRKVIQLLTLAAFSAAPMTLSPAVASGNTKPQTQLTVGNCISDVVYGNEPNMANGAPGGPAEQTPGTQAGNVVPTQSPGPFVNNPTDPSNPTRGSSVGQFQQNGVNIPALCRAAVRP